MTDPNRLAKIVKTADDFRKAAFSQVNGLILATMQTIADLHTLEEIDQKLEEEWAKSPLDYEEIFFYLQLRGLKR